MSDNQNHNDPVERLFKKKAEEYDVSYREEDWNSLANKLELQDARISYRRKMSLMAAASFLIIGFFGYVTFDNYNRLNQLSDQLSGGIVSPIPLPSDSQPRDNGSNDEPTDLTQVNPTETDEFTSVHSTDSTQFVLESADEIRNEIDRSSQIYKASFTDDDLISNLRNELPSESFQKVHTPSRLPATIPDTAQIASSAPVTEPTTHARASSRISVGLLASPDLSTVGSFSNFDRTGYKLGATVEYSLSEKLSVSAGLIHTQVNYSAHSHQYNAQSYGYNGVSPDQMFAECLLFDIPITVKYNVANFDRSRFFATAGLSSYIMQNEDYYFSYNQEAPGQMDSWSERTGTRHWFSNAGFSIGYELDIHPQWNIRFEPFIKVPIQEIGWGNVKLYSVGSFVSLNYRL
ncbi:MAG: hypothetical protein WD381_00265 [Balneolaceae bacterium]